MLNFFSCISLNFWYTRKKEGGGLFLSPTLVLMRSFTLSFQFCLTCTLTRLLTIFTKSSFLKIIINFYKSCELVLNFTKHTQFRSFYRDDNQIGDEIDIRESN
jgi:hypothetical protein